MDKPVHVRSLGNTYSIANRHGEVVERIQLVSADQILSFAQGPYDREIHGTFRNYLRKSVKSMSNHDDVDYTRIMWHVNRDPEGVYIHDIVKTAYNRGFNTVIIEDLSENATQHSFNS